MIWLEYDCCSFQGYLVIKEDIKKMLENAIFSHHFSTVVVASHPFPANIFVRNHIFPRELLR